MRARARPGIGSDTRGNNLFLWQKGTLTSLGGLGGVDHGGGEAFFINNSGQIVGTSVTADGSEHGFLWQNSIMTDLNDVIPTNSNLTIVSGRGINNAGQIVGYGSNNLGIPQPFLMTPV